MREELLRLIDLADDVFPDDYKGSAALREMCDGMRALAEKCAEPNGYVEWQLRTRGTDQPEVKLRRVQVAPPSQPVALPDGVVAFLRYAAANAKVSRGRVYFDDAQTFRSLLAAAPNLSDSVEVPRDNSKGE